MDAAIVIARIMGPIFVVVTLGLLVNRAAYEEMFEDFINSPGLVYFGGLMALASGLVLVLFHNVWRADWTLIITLLGWSSLVKGLFLLLYPKPLLELSNKIIGNSVFMRVWPVFGLAVGSFLCFKGYGP